MGKLLPRTRKRITTRRLRFLLRLPTPTRQRRAPHHLRSHGFLFRRQPSPSHTSPWTSNLNACSDNRRRARQTSNGHHTTISNLLTTQATLHHARKPRVQHRHTRHHPHPHHPLLHSRRSVRVFPRHDRLVQPSRSSLHR